jgi:hypothetical protein
MMATPAMASTMKWLPVIVIADSVITGYTTPTTLSHVWPDRKNMNPKIVVHVKCRLGMAAKAL